MPRRRNRRSAPRRRPTVVLGLAWLLMPAAGAAAPDEASLQQALEALERDGLTIFYSSELVRPGMRVPEPLPEGSPRDRLDAMLAPLGLAARPGPGGSVMIVRAAGAEDPAARGAGPRDEGADRPARSGVGSDVRPSLEEIVVSASRYELGRSFATSAAVLSRDDIEYSPDIGDDSLRSASRLPGYAANGFSARSNVRGGAIGETLVRFDGLRLYEPYHLQHFQSVFSTIDPRIVRTMTVYTGVFPAVYGDRLSSVIDVQSLSPPGDRYHEVAVSFFNASVLSAGRFGGGRGEWVASLRRSNLDLLYSALSAHEDRPRYVDAYAKVGYALGERFRVTGNVLYFDDDIALADDIDLEERAFSDDRDRYAWVRVDHAPGARLSGATLLARSHLATDRRGVTAKEGTGSGSLDDRRSFDIDTLQSEWTWAAGDRLAVRFGGALSHGKGRYDYRQEAEFDLLLEADGAPASAARSRSIEARPRDERYTLFGSVLYRPTPRLALDIGLRREEQRLESRARVAFDPRFGASFRVADDTVLKIGWGRFHQFQNVTELQIEDGVTEFHAPQAADQRVVALEHGFGEGPRLRIEAYEKKYGSLHPRYENLLMPLTLLPELKPDRIEIAPSSARAQGVELMLSGQPSDTLSWWLAYGRARVEDRFAGLSIDRAWDQRNAISAAATWDSPKWNIAVGLIHRSGWPRTPVAALRTDADLPIIVAGPRNSARNGAYRSLDLRLTRKIGLESSSLVVFLEISNALGRGNPCCVEYEVEENEAGRLELDLSRIDYPPLVPSIGFVWSLGAPDAAGSLDARPDPGSAGRRR